MYTTGPGKGGTKGTLDVTRIQGNLKERYRITRSTFSIATFYVAHVY